MSELHPFLQSFVDEHVLIQKELSVRFEAEDWRGFFESARALLPPHELREEKFLFPALATKVEVRTGGPMCTLFFDKHIKNPPLARAAAACGQKQFQPSPANVALHLRKFFEENLPVCVPLQDHFALEQILRASLTAEPPSLPFLAATFFSMLKLHIEKEDRCLLVMCSQIVSGQEWDSWSLKSKAG